MVKQFVEIMRATKVFIFVRAVAAFAICVLYILAAAAIQYYYVQLFGESTFNYIVGGILSLIAGVALCGTLGKFVFMFVRGWHVGAIVYSSAIIDRNLPALEVGMAVFKKHVTSFTVVYSIGVLLRKFTAGAVEKVWDLLADVPFVSSLKKIAEWPVVKRLGADLLDTSFDCVVYYLAKYTKKGVADDLSSIPEALRRYLYSLPKLAGTSVAWFFLSWFIPKVVRILLCVYVFRNGIVGGILLNVLMFPAFYFLTRVVFEPVRTALFISAYAEQCQEEPAEDCPYKTLIEGLIEALGLKELFNSNAAADTKDEEPAQVKRSPKPTKKKASEVDHEEEDPSDTEEGCDDFVAEVLASSAATIPNLADLENSVDEGFAPAKKSGNPFTLPVAGLLDEDEDDDAQPAISSLSSLLSQQFDMSNMNMLIADMDAEGDCMDNLDDQM